MASLGKNTGDGATIVTIGNKSAENTPVASPLISRNPISDPNEENDSSLYLPSPIMSRLYSSSSIPMHSSLSQWGKYSD